MSDITLNKIKVRDDLGLELKWQQDVETEDGTVLVKSSMDTPISQHLDLRKAIDGLTEHLLRVHSMIKGSLDKEGKKMIEQSSIVSLQLTGKEESFGVIIKGKSSVLGNQSVDLLTPVINLGDSASYEKAGELKAVVETVVREVKLYLFEKKNGQNILALQVVNKAA